MSDERIVDVSTILSKWHDLLKSRWPNFPCQTFTMFMHNNSQELVRCRECIFRGQWDICPMCVRVYMLDKKAYLDCTEDDGFCHMGAKLDGGAE